MSIITRMLKQTCVYWPMGSSDSGSDDFDDQGFPILADPIELKCRWEDVNEEFITANETKMTSKSKVYVESDADVGGVLMLGLLSDVTDLVNVKENDGADEIKRFDKIPNLKATEFVRLAWL